MPYKVAVVEDDELIRNIITFNLEKNGYRVDWYPSSESFLGEYTKNLYDLLILDIFLPGSSGIDLLKKMRKAEDNTPVLMLTVKKDIPTRIGALDLGADDYIVKPFNIDELMARVRALIRRSVGKRRIPSSGIIIVNGHGVDMSSRQCESNIGRVTLSDKEIKLLAFFFSHRNEPLSRADILEEVWGMDVAPTPRTVDNFILKFRKLFEDNPEDPKHFTSVRNKGYRFNY